MQATDRALQAIADAFGADTVTIGYYRADEALGYSFYSVTVIGARFPLMEGPSRGTLSTTVTELHFETILAELAKDRARRQSEFAARAAQFNANAA